MELLPQPTAESAAFSGRPVTGAPLDWDWAEQRLREARNFWIATTRAAGPPHCRPVWGAWRPTGLWFVTSSVAVRNLAARPEITVHLESGVEVVIMEGRAQPCADGEQLAELVEIYNEKYATRSECTDGGMLTIGGSPGRVHVVRPRVAFGWSGDPERSTRWRW